MRYNKDIEDYICNEYKTGNKVMNNISTKATERFRIPIRPDRVSRILYRNNLRNPRKAPYMNRPQIHDMIINGEARELELPPNFIHRLLAGEKL